MVLFLSTSPHFLCRRRGHVSLKTDILLCVSLCLLNLNNLLHYSVIVIFVRLVKL